MSTRNSICGMPATQVDTCFWLQKALGAMLASMNFVGRHHQLGCRLFAGIGQSPAACRQAQASLSPRCANELVTLPHWQQAPRDGMEAPLASARNLLGILREENIRLRSQLRQMCWPKVTSFAAFGHTYDLPCSGATLPVSSLDLQVTSHSRLRYLSGFFDGDGCCFASKKKCTLQVAQSFDRAEILVLFLTALGGTIYRNNTGRGLQKPTLVWQTCGANAKAVAGLLASNSIIKRRQLKLVQDWPQQSVDRGAAAEELKDLKRHDSGVESPCTWEYVSGFFDADGCIQLRTKTTMKLCVGQKFLTSLECVRQFLVRELGCNVGISRSQGLFRLNVTTTTACRSILRNMLAAGLIQKANQARLALSLTLENAEQVRNAVGKLVGNQAFGRRKNLEGLLRAQQIKGVQQKARKALQKGRQDKVVSAMQQVEVLKADCELQQARLENRQLKEYLLMLRHLQQQGWRTLSNFKQAEQDKG